MENDMATEQLRKVRAEIRKLGAESDKLMMETRWYPMVLASAWIAAIIAATKLFL